jgi:hypothetical protein
MLPEEMHGSSVSDNGRSASWTLLYIQSAPLPPAIFQSYHTSRAWASVFDITNISAMLSLEAVPSLEMDIALASAEEHSPDTSTSDRVIWASPADWERQKPLITQLYVDEKRSLNQVMEIMADEHDHNATSVHDHLPFPP